MGGQSWEREDEYKERNSFCESGLDEGLGDIRLGWGRQRRLR